MSVAFRRDSDEEHLEPRFELPIPAGTNTVTARGLDLIKGRVAEYETKLKDADTEETQKPLKRDLRYWQNRLSTAEIAPIPSGDTVEFGVTVRILLDGKARTFGIVGDDEADPASGLISFKSPLGRALIGAEKGDYLAFRNVDDAIEIVAIEVLDSGVTVHSE